jgi:hypothetical protein
MSREFSPHEVSDSRRDLNPLEDHEITRDVAGRAPFQGSPERGPRRPVETDGKEVQFSGSRVVLYDRDQGYQLTEAEIRTLSELGKFRVVAEHDLAQHMYGGETDEAGRDTQRLIRLGLVRNGIFAGPEATPRKLLTLTRRGHRLLRANQLVPRDQAVYHGFVKPKEANHDADLYLLYQKEAARIHSDGGKNLRVILDYELKRKINRDISRFGAAAKDEIAERHGLRVIGHKIPVPDMRIEYENREGELARVNLELVTEHYRGRSIAEKVRAGFSIFTPHGEADHLRRVLDQQELTAEILSL